jgi:hypothetical protein
MYILKNVDGIDTKEYLVIDSIGNIIDRINCSAEDIKGIVKDNNYTVISAMDYCVLRMNGNNI